MARKEAQRKLEEIVKKLGLECVGQLQKLQSKCERAGHPGEKVKFYLGEKAVCECSNCYKQYERKLRIAEYDSRKPFSHKELYRA